MNHGVVPSEEEVLFESRMWVPICSLHHKLPVHQGGQIVDLPPADTNNYHDLCHCRVDQVLVGFLHHCR